MSSAATEPGLEKLRILHVWADPLGLPPTGAAVEVAGLKTELEPYSAIIEYRDQPACSVDELLRLLNGFDPHILQFSGHGDTGGGITLLHPDFGGPSVLGKAELASLLRGRSKLWLLVLNCCHGLVNVETLEGTVRAVIGVKGAVQEPYPIVFSCALYNSIASRRSLDDAVRCAVLAARERHGGEGWDHFELWPPDARGSDDLPPGPPVAAVPRPRYAVAASAALGLALLAATAPSLHEHAPPLAKNLSFVMGLASLALAAMAVRTTAKRTRRVTRSLACIVAAALAAVAYEVAFQWTSVSVPDYGGEHLQIGFGLTAWSLTPEAQSYVREQSLGTARELVEWTTYDQEAIERGWTPWSVQAASLLLIALFTTSIALGTYGLGLLAAALAT